MKRELIKRAKRRTAKLILTMVSRSSFKGKIIEHRKRFDSFKFPSVQFDGRHFVGFFFVLKM